MTEKPSNPKDSVGVRKAPMSTVPAEVMLEVGLAMLEGARKYGRHNYRAVGVRASVYYDATMRHLMAWWEGQDVDPDSGLSHLTKAIAGLVVLRDSMIQRNWQDDRPPVLLDGWVGALNALAGAIIDRHPDPKDAYVQVNDAAPVQVDECDAFLDEYLPPLCQAEDGHCTFKILPGETAYKCIYCGAVPVLTKQECEHRWMPFVIPGYPAMDYCTKCGVKTEIQAGS